VNRRSFLGGLTLGTIVRPAAATAQQGGTVPRIGYLSNSSGDSAPDRAFMGALRDLGYVAGRTLNIEARYSSGRPERFAEFATELLGLGVDLIAVWSPAGVAAVSHSTQTIPIVGISMGDPILRGWVGTLARPGTNLTGLSSGGVELNGKRLELLKAAVPQVSRFAVLANPTQPTTGYLEATMSASRSLMVQVEVFNASKPTTFEDVFAEIIRRRIGALLVLPDAMFWGYRARIVDLASRSRLPAMYWSRDYSEVGGLLSYAPSLADLGRRAAVYVDKILKGAKPGDLPVEEPTMFEFVINFKTAKALGLTIPPALLQRADQVIE
jgi:putative ABC transport system substrate-binding protein